MSYTFKELEKRTQISVHTLRYWAKVGLFPNITRSDNDYHLFSDSDVLWAGTVRCLRETGMSIKNVLEYLKLCEKGESTLDARIAILQDQKSEILATLQTYQNALQHIENKIALMQAKQKNTLQSEQLDHAYQTQMLKQNYQALKNHSTQKKKLKK